MELGIGVRMNPSVDGLTDVAMHADIVDQDVLAPHPGGFDQFRHQSLDHLGAGQAILRSPGRPPAPDEEPLCPIPGARPGCN